MTSAARISSGSVASDSPERLRRALERARDAVGGTPSRADASDRVDRVAERAPGARLNDIVAAGNWP